MRKWLSINAVGVLYFELRKNIKSIGENAKNNQRRMRALGIENDGAFSSGNR